MIRLTDVIKARLGNWSLALLIGSLTLLAVICLLAISGWFITAAAMAGLLTVAGAYGFDYFRPAALIRLCAIARTAGRYAERLTSHYAALGLLKDLRCKVFGQLAQQQTPLTGQQPGSASTLHRLVSDIDQLDNLPLRVVLPWLWGSLLVLLVMLFFWLLSPALLQATLLPLLLAWLGVPLLTTLKGFRLATAEHHQAELRRTQLLEPLQLLTPLLLWQRWQGFSQQFQQTDLNYQQQQQRQQRLISLAVLLQQLCLGATLLMLIWQSIPLVQQQQLSVPFALAACLALLALNEILPPLCHSFVALGFSLAARDRLNQLVTQPQQPHDASLAISLPISLAEKWTLTADQLSARQIGALSGPQQLSFSVAAGQSLLITGPSGCGKSTLLQVLAGELAADHGQIKLNQQVMPSAQLAPLCALLPQQPDIFDMTLARNLRLADASATDEQLWQVLEKVALADWVKQQPQKLNTTAGEYGTRLSGGQARRLALARLLLTQRPVMLLDEPFAGLDQATSQQVLQALLQHQQHGVLIIVSHQPLPVALSAELAWQTHTTD